MNHFEVPSSDRHQAPVDKDVLRDIPSEAKLIIPDESKSFGIQQMKREQAIKDNRQYLEILEKINKKESPQEKRIANILRTESGLSDKEIAQMHEKISFTRMIEASEAILKSHKDVQSPWTEDGLEKMVAALGTLAYKMRDSLGLYDLIVGDDSSGRLPALFFWKLANNARLKEKLSEDTKIMFIAYRRPPTANIVGSEQDFSGDEWADAVRKRFSQKEVPLGRTLLISEYSSTGGTINAFENALHSTDRSVDAAIVSVEKNISAKLSHGGKLFFGSNGPRKIGEYAFEHEQKKSTLRGRLFPWFFPDERPQQVRDRYDISGVQKTRNPNDTFASRSESANIERMRLSREIMNAMADVAAEKLFSESSNQEPLFDKKNID